MVIFGLQINIQERTKQTLPLSFRNTLMYFSYLILLELLIGSLSMIVLIKVEQHEILKHFTQSVPLV